MEAEEVSTGRGEERLPTFCILMRTRGTEHMRVGCSRLMSPYTNTFTSQTLTDGNIAEFILVIGVVAVFG